LIQRNNGERFASFSLIGVLLLVVLSLACSFSLGRVTPTPTAVTPPIDQAVSFKVPIYTTTLKPGERVPGTQMVYVKRDGDVFHVMIDELSAEKRGGDSFSWKGIIAPGFIASYNLRISPPLLGDSLVAAGPVDLWVLNPIPVDGDVDPLTRNAIFHFTNIALDVKTPIGEQVHGTSLIYEGVDEQGAIIAGSGPYPYRSGGDSIVWSGRLRGNVLARFSFRVVSYDEESLHLLGTAELWVI